MTRLHLIQLAGGQGLRAEAGGLPPKQFRPTAQGPLFTISLTAFLSLPTDVATIASLTVTVPKVWRNAVTGTLGNLAELDGVPWHLAAAGATRTQSTWNAVEYLAGLSPQPEDLVAIHDAARPFASVDLLVRLVRAAQTQGGAVPGVPVPDTILRTNPQGQGEYLDRSRLVAVQTPQVFRWDLLHAAHAWAAENRQEFTDDGGLLAARGHDPAVVEGEDTNWKVTTDGDWRRAGPLLD
jgi:2-C-methyl-D-erythritol 4-phosphate cytidylyltransferase/2-C-methyl-D-erythritol 2,4-cyclodiphosphate synthase